jgi:putative ABC transport system substrate-binding protein
MIARMLAVGRRAFLLASPMGLVALVLPVHAQPQPKVARVGLLSPVAASEYEAAADAFRQGLNEHGYVENRNLTIEYRWAGGDVGRLPVFAVELVRLNVDVIVAHGLAAVLAAKAATASTPIVMVATFDPVRSGLVSSLSRPGGNVTGLAYPESTDELSGKWIQLLIEIVPRLSRLIVLANAENASHPKRLKDIEAAARALRVEVYTVEMRQQDVEWALAAVGQVSAGALIVLPDPLFTNHRHRITAFALERRHPTVYAFREFPDAGGLLSYGPSLATFFRHAAVFVDKIVKGAKPRDLPVQQPAKFELVVNLKTARALGLTISPSLVLRADQVIE